MRSDETRDVPSTRLQREVDALLDSHGGLERYQRATLDAPSVVASFVWNLRKMVEACKERGVAIVLVVPTVNVLDCPPFKIQPDPNLGTDQAKELETLWQNAQQEPDPSDAIVKTLQRMLEIDRKHAGAHYKLGQLAVARRDEATAHQHLIAAKDFDVCPLRATTEIQQAVRDVAAEHRVRVLDADRLFQSKADLGLVGSPWFVDHVHPSVEGHQWLGEALAELLVETRWLAPVKQDWTSQRPDCYREHLSTLGEEYFIRGKQRLEGLMLWTQGRARKIGEAKK